MEALPMNLMALLGSALCLVVLGLGGIAGLVVLLLKLGVIGQYALKQEAEEIDAEYSINQSREVRYEGEPKEE
jgi:Na+-transporting methylmalonyl-CoA/oxaloacetate decarboxylase gamma subunit